MSTAQENLGVQVEADLKRDLERIAKENDRTLSAEVRRALRLYCWENALKAGETRGKKVKP